MKLFVALIFLTGCAGQADMVKVANSLEAVKSLYRVACEPEPTTRLCAESKAAINDLIDVYDEVNE
jgi:hypothetical protein